VHVRLAEGTARLSDSPQPDGIGNLLPVVIQVYARGPVHVVYPFVMANLKRVRCPWQGGGVVGPSVTTFYFSATATGFPAQLQTFFQAIKSSLPDDVVITVPNTGDTVRETDGVLQGVWTDSGGSTTTGTAAGAFAKGSGVRIQWITSGIRDGRRIIGSTFLVPVAGAVFDTTGIVAGASLSVLQTAAGALVSAASPGFLIWSKPHTKLAADGASNPVLAAVVRSEATGLRSRRT
jgi:hypothetical protein